MNFRLLFLLGTNIGQEVRPDGKLVRETLIANTWDFGWLGSSRPSLELTRRPRHNWKRWGRRRKEIRE